MTNASGCARATLRWLGPLALVATLSACLPSAGLQSDGSVVLHAERAGAGWMVTVPDALVGRSLELRRPFAAAVVVPRGFAPPPGLCRVWLPGVAPALQTPFEACPLLEPDVPAGAYLIKG